MTQQSIYNWHIYKSKLEQEIERKPQNLQTATHKSAEKQKSRNEVDENEMKSKGRRNCL